jgi:hypothetical protein
MIKKILNIIAIFVLLVNVVSVSAQTASPIPSINEPVDEVADLQFPIEDLGGCEDYKSCLTFCDDPVNNAACSEFAKKNGFYKDDPILAPTDDFLAKAKDVLGCETAEACATFCGESANFDACNAFAKSQGMLGGYVEEIADDSVVIDQAQEVLGCSDAQSCLTFCDDPANQDQCDKFADQEGLLGGEVPVGPGGCTTPQTCQNFCSDPANFEECKGAVSGNFTGPGGCNSPEACRTYCEENPNECRSYAPGSNGVYVPATCPAGQDFGPGGICTPNEKTQEAGSCSQGGKFWDGGSCQDNPPPGVHPTIGGAYFQPRPEMGGCVNPGACYDYCKENPNSCPSFSPNSTRPKDGYNPVLYYTPGTEVKFPPKAEMGGCDSPGGCYDYCKENPGKCQGFDDKSPRPVDTYMPGTYYTPPTDQRYYTPPITGFYVTPIYFTPPSGSNYTTPTYYTPGMYSTPTYYTPFTGSNYTTPTYYTPGAYLQTSSNGQYPTPTYPTPTYYTPPLLAAYNTPTYYTPPQYVTPSYYTPPSGSNYTTPSYPTPTAYTTPFYPTPFTGGTYTTPTYYTPPAGYTTPTYSSPSYYYPTPTAGYTTPTYPTPASGSTYTSPTYYTPGGSYYYPSPTSTGSYASPSYYYPTPGTTGYPTPYYPTPTSYSYPTPGTGYTYPSPGYITPGSYYNTPGSGYTYPSPPTGYSYPTPSGYSYPTPSTYTTPPYSTPPAYGTPADSYTTPAYGTPPEYPTPSVQGAHTEKNFFELLVDFFRP